jgi:predicted nucleic acid-binding protein
MNQGLRKATPNRRIDDAVRTYGEEITTTLGAFCVSPMSVLIDTSVWVAHFKQRDERLVKLLEAGLVVCHPFIVTEIACGTPSDRRFVLSLLMALEKCAVATQDEVLVFIEQRALHGKGCGLVDLSLLASALINKNTLIWTLDKRLEAIALELGRAYQANLHSSNLCI